MKSLLSQTPLSILNLVNYSQGRTIADAFAAARELAQKAESWGFKRYWMAEHHNLEGVASAATVVLITYIATQTQSIRVGSGGIMLPNHSPLIVAEQFGTLATLFPDRIDLGLGRAPGTDPHTMRAIRGHGGSRGDDFPEMLAELLYYFSPAEPDQKLKAIPGAGIEVPIWLLGSSLFSARLAAQLGRPYAFAGHFAPQLMKEAFDLYRAEFRPSAVLKKPHTMLGVPVVAADTDEEAQYLATSVFQVFLSLIRGQLKQTPPPVQNMQSLWSPGEEAAVRSMMKNFIAGGPETVRQKLEEIISYTKADELILTSDLYQPKDRLRSLEIIAGVAFSRS